MILLTGNNMYIKYYRDFKKFKYYLCNSQPNHISCSFTMAWQKRNDNIYILMSTLQIIFFFLLYYVPAWLFMCRNYWRDFDTALFILNHLYRDIPEEPMSPAQSDEGNTSNYQKGPKGRFYQNDGVDEEFPLTFSDKILVKEFSIKVRKAMKRGWLLPLRSSSSSLKLIRWCVTSKANLDVVLILCPRYDRSNWMILLDTTMYICRSSRSDVYILLPRALPFVQIG